jgi:hypothetical protein
MRELPWRIVAAIVSRPSVRDGLIRRAKRTPYVPITGPDGSTYMGRWWLFNPYPPKSDGGGDRRGLRGWLPSIRIHHILRPDSDRHLHDHPWNARTVILQGWYIEERPGRLAPRLYERTAGYTGRLLFGQYHRIEEVSPGGVWTLFITWRKQGTWGFLVDGKKVPWREYLKESA